MTLRTIYNDRLVDGQKIDNLPADVNAELANKADASTLAGHMADNHNPHADAFITLTDVPSSYSGQSGKLVKVKVTEDGLEFGVGGSGAGDVVGPSSATDSNIAVFDGTTGKLIKDGGATIASKQNALSGTGFVKASGTTISYDNSTYLTSLSGAVLTNQTSGQTIGATGARLTKLWATDITCTNAISGSVTGNAGTVTNGVYTTSKLSALSATTSAELAGVISDETGTGLLVFNNSPTFVDDITVGTASTATGIVKLKGTTSGTVSLSVADAAGTWTMKLPTTAGTSGYFLSTDGSGNSSWASEKLMYTKSVGYSAADYIVDGTNDNTEIQSAVTASGAGGSVFLRSGTYNYPTSSEAKVTLLDNQSIFGSGTTTVLKKTYKDATWAEYAILELRGVTKMSIKDLYFNGAQDDSAGANKSGAGIFVGILDPDGTPVYSKDISISNCSFFDGGHGISIKGDYDLATYITAINIDDIHICNNEHGIAILRGSDVNISNVIAEKRAVDARTGYLQRGIGIWDSHNININNVRINQADVGIYLRQQAGVDDTWCINVNNVFSEQCSSYSLAIEAKDYKVRDVNINNYIGKDCLVHCILLATSVDGNINNVNINNYHGNTYGAGAGYGLVHKGENDTLTTYGSLNNIFISSSTFDAKYNAIRILKGANIICRNSTFTSSESASAAGYFKNVTRLTIEDCVFTAAGTATAELYIEACTDINITRCSFPQGKITLVGACTGTIDGVSISETLTGAGAVSPIIHTTKLVTTGTNAITLADGVEGATKTIVVKTDGGVATLTPTNPGNFTTLTFANAGDTADLIFTNGKWYYTGGNIADQITANSINVGLIDYNTSPTVTPGTAGQTYWDTTHKTLATDLNANVTLQHGQEINRYVYNADSVTIGNGKVVYTYGVQGHYPAVKLAKADVAATAVVSGIATESIASGAYGYITVIGDIHDVDTSAYTTGDLLYLSDTTAGAMTKTPPARSVACAKVTVVNASTGTIFANIAESAGDSLKQAAFVGFDEMTPVTVSINYTTRVLTVSPVTGTTFSFVVDGGGVPKRFIKTATNFTAFTDTSGWWYFYFDSNGDPQTTQTAWTVTEFPTKVPVYRLNWNATLSPDSAKSVVEDIEYHEASISADDHAWKHTFGSIWMNGLDIKCTPLTTTPNASGVNTCVSVTTGTIDDDNLEVTVTNSTAGTAFTQDMGNITPASITVSNSGLFPIRYQSGAGLQYRTTATRFPFAYNGSTNLPQYITSTGTFTDVSNGYYFVYFLFMAQDPRTGQQVKLVSATSEYAAIADARAVTWDQIKSTYTVFSNEVRPLYRLIFRYRNTYDVAVKYTGLEETQDLRVGQVTQTNVTGSIPATSVTVTPTGNIASTNVQSALAELDTEKAPLASPSFTTNVLLTGTANNGFKIKQGDQIDTAALSTHFYNGIAFENTSTTHAFGAGYSTSGNFSINYFDGTSTYTNLMLLSSAGALTTTAGITATTIKLTTGAVNGYVLTSDASGNGSWAAPTGGGGGITWNEVTGTSQSMAVDNGYIANNGSLVTLTLPSTAAIGKVVRASGKGAGLFKIAQGANQYIRFNSTTSTTGTGGYITANEQYCSIELVCSTADNGWTVTSSSGNFTVT